MGWLVRNIGQVPADDANIFSFPDSGENDPVTGSAATAPGAGATNTNIAAGGASLDTAFAAAGKLNIRIGGIDQYLYSFRRT